MFARLGRVVYWASCLIACCLIVGGVAVGINEIDASVISLFSIPVYLFGLACLYIFSNEAPKWHRMEKFMALIATLGVASFSIVMIDSQMDKATPAWMDSPIVEESAGSEKTSLNEEEGTIIYEEVDYDPFAGEKSAITHEQLEALTLQLEAMPPEKREAITRRIMEEDEEDWKKLPREDVIARRNFLKKLIETEAQEKKTQESQQ